jgi:lysophospholipase L1-like esterase
MAALVGHISAASTNQNTIATGTLDTTGANLLVVSLSGFKTGSPVLSDSKGNTWTPLTNHSGAGNPSNRLYYCLAPTVGTGHTFTATGTGIYTTIDVQAFSGADTSGGTDGENGAGVITVTSGQPGTLTPSQANDIIVASIAFDDPSTVSVNQSFTITDQNGLTSNHWGGAMAYLLQGSAAAVNPTWTWTTTGNAALSLACFKTSAGVASATITEQNLPANHNGNITVHAVGTNTNWTSSTTWTPSGVAGWTVASKTFVDATHYTIVLTGPAALPAAAGATGTLTLTEGVTGTVTATTTIGAVGLSISPTSGTTGTTPTLTLTGTKTIWTTETAAGLFTVTGGTGASIATPTGITNTGATAVLTVGTASGTLTIKDTSTGATATFTASTPPLVSGALSVTSGAPTTLTLATTAASGGTAPYTYQWYRSTTSGFTPGGGNILSGATSTTLTDTGLVFGTIYYYKVVATDSQGTPATVTSTEQCASPWDTPLVIGGIGDSIMRYVPSGGTINPLTSMGNHLARMTGRRNVTLSNQAVDATATINWLPASSNYITAKAAFVAASATWVHIMLGTNDIWNSVSQATYLSNMTSIVNDLIGSGFKVVLHASPYPQIPSTSAVTFTEAEVAVLQSYRASLASLVNNTTVYMGDTLAFSWFAMNTTEQVDGVHPNIPGVETLGYLWAQAFYKILYPAAASAGVRKVGLNGGING